MDAINDFNASVARLNRNPENRSAQEKSLRLLNVILDCATRWNSLYFMLERAYYLRKVCE